MHTSQSRVHIAVSTEWVLSQTNKSCLCKSSLPFTSQSVWLRHPCSTNCFKALTSPRSFSRLQVSKVVRNGRGAFSHQSDTRQAHELWAGLMCANSSACLCKKPTFKKRGQARSTFLPNPHRSVMCDSYFRQLGFKCRLSQLHQCDQEMLPTRLPWKFIEELLFS